MEFTVLQQKTLTHDFQADFGGWGTGSRSGHLGNIWETGEGPQLRPVLESRGRRAVRARAARSSTARSGPPSTAEIHEILYEDQPYTWLYFRNAFYGFNKELRGYVFSPAGRITTARASPASGQPTAVAHVRDRCMLNYLIRRIWRSAC